MHPNSSMNSGESEIDDPNRFDALKWNNQMKSASESSHKPDFDERH